MTDRSWTDMFDPRGGRPPGCLPPASLPDTEPDDVALAIDPNEYQPWVLQRGRSRPAMMLHLRRYEPKSGLWMGWAMSYPSLIAVEYVGDRMVSLDFGTRQFMIQGEGLDQMIDVLQEAHILSIHENSSIIWPVLSAPYISSIKRLDKSI